MLSVLKIVTSYMYVLDARVCAYRMRMYLNTVQLVNGDWWNPLTKGQQCRHRFLVIHSAESGAKLRLIH